MNNSNDVGGFQPVAGLYDGIAYENLATGSFAVLGCLTVLFFMPYARIQSNLKTLIWSLSFADLGAVIEICFVEAFLSTLHQTMPIMFGYNWLCQLHSFLMDSFEVLSQVLATILAVERCHAVCSPFSARKMTGSVTRVAVGCAVVASFGATVPTWFYYTITAGGVCTTHSEHPLDAYVFVILRHTIVEHLLFPLVIVSCNFTILFTLVLRSRTHSKILHPSQPGAKKSGSLRITKALIAIGMIHAIFLAPCGILCQFMFVLSDSSLGAAMWEFAKLSYGVYALARGMNVVIYAATIDSFAAVLKSPPCFTSASNRNKLRFDDS